MSLWIDTNEVVCNNQSSRTSVSSTIVSSTTLLGDFFELEDFTVLRNNLMKAMLKDPFHYAASNIRQARLEDMNAMIDYIIQYRNKFNYLSKEYIEDPFTDMCLFLAIYHENKLKLDNGGIDLD